MRKIVRICFVVTLLSIFNFQLSTAQTPFPDFEELFRRAPVFNQHWDTIRLEAYREITANELPASIRLQIADNLPGAFYPPAQGRVPSKFGPRGRRPHRGTDIKVDHGQPVYAAFDGIVRFSRLNRGGFGNLVIVRHANGLETYYAHLSKRSVRAGDVVAAGDVVGLGGRTGRASGNHLHFEVRYLDRSFDPEWLIDFTTGELLATEFTLRKSYFEIRSRAVRGLDEEQLLALALEREAEAYHTIRSGDNLSTLAGRYGTSVSELCRLNGISSSTTLSIGRTLRVR